MTRPGLEPRRPLRAALLALLLGALCLGEALLPGRALLPQPFATIATPELAIRTEGSELTLPQVPPATPEAAVPHRQDKLLQFYPFDTFVGDAWREGRAPLWTPRTLCGLPLLAQGTARAFYPSAALFAFVEPSSAYAWLWLLHLTLAGLFAYRLVRRLGGTEGGGLLACGTLVLSGWAAGHVQHPMIFEAAIWTLPALEAVHALLRPEAARPRPWRPCLGLALAVALSWFAGFAQASVLLSYLVVLFAGVLTLVAWRERRDAVPGRRALLGVLGRPLLWPAAGLVLGTLLAMVQILPMLEMAAHASREPATLALLQDYALPPAGLLELLLPGQLCVPGEILVDAGGLSSRPSFVALSLLGKEQAQRLAMGAFNLNHTEMALGIGFWPLVFALGTWRVPFSREAPLARRATLGLLWGIALVGLLGAMALPGLVHLLHALPGFTVGDFKRLLMLPALALPLLAGLGWRPLRAELLPAAAFFGILVAFAGIALLALSTERFAAGFGAWIAPRFGASAEQFVAALAPGEAEHNQLWLGSGVLFGGLAIGLGPLLARELKLGAVGFLVAALLTQLPIAWDATPAPAQPELRKFARDRWQTPDRPGRIVTNEVVPAGQPARGPGDMRLGAPWLGPHAAATGYAPLAPRRLEALFALVAPEAVSHGAGLGPLRSPALAPDRELRLLQDLGVTHVLSSVPLPPATGAEAPDLLLPHAPGLGNELGELLDSPPPSGHAIPYRLPAASEERWPAAEWLPHVQPVAGPDAALELLRRRYSGAAATAPVPIEMPAAWRTQAAGESHGEVHVLGPGGPLQMPPFHFRTRASDPGWMLVRYGWMPGFEYRIDAGTWQPSFPALLALQALPIPAGEHEVTLRYRPRSFVLGTILSLLAAASLLGLPLLPRLARRPFRRRDGARAPIAQPRP